MCFFDLEGNGALGQNWIHPLYGTKDTSSLEIRPFPNRKLGTHKKHVKDFKGGLYMEGIKVPLLNTLSCYCKV